MQICWIHRKRGWKWQKSTLVGGVMDFPKPNAIHNHCFQAVFFPEWECKMKKSQQETEKLSGENNRKRAVSHSCYTHIVLSVTLTPLYIMPIQRFKQAYCAGLGACRSTLPNPAPPPPPPIVVAIMWTVHSLLMHYENCMCRGGILCHSPVQYCMLYLHSQTSE